jgi:hypothetical protein
MMLLCVNMGWGQGQTIGSFPYMEGGFEKYSASTLSTISTTAWSVSSTGNSSTKAILSDAAAARSGSKYASHTTTNTTVRLQTPYTTTIANAPLTNTPYTIQYYYKTTTDQTNSLQGGIYNNTTNGATNNSKNALVTSTYASGVWTKAYVSLTSNSDAVSAATNFACVRHLLTTTSNVLIDDFVVYAGGVDNTSPVGPTVPIVSGTNVSWTASADVDGGGYVVVRYSTLPNADNDPNTNGIYGVGNTIANGTGALVGTVVYVGKDTFFIDGVAGSVSGSDYYKIYTVDKAFNYSKTDEITGTAVAAGSPLITSTKSALSGFAYNQGNGPSTGQSFTVAGTNLTNNLVVTPSTNYEISDDGGETYNSLARTYVPSSSTVTDKVIFARLKAGLTANAYNETITIASSGANVLSGVACSGVVTSLYYYNGTGPLATETSWGLNTDGSGTQPVFTGNYQSFIIKNTTAVTTDALWTVSGTNSKIILGDPSAAAVTLTVANTFPITGTIDIPAAASSGSNSLVLQDALQPTFGTLDNTSEVHLQSSASTTYTTSATFGKLIVDGTGSLTITGNPVIKTALEVPVGGRLTYAGTSTLYVVINAGASVTINGYLKGGKAAGIFSYGVATPGSGFGTFQFKDAVANLTLGAVSTVEYNRSTAGSSQSISILPTGVNYANLTISDGGTPADCPKSFAGPVTVTGMFTLNQNLSALTSGGSLTLGNGATIVRTAGALDAAPTFGSSVNVTYNGLTAQTAGVEIPSSGLKALTINNAVSVTFSSLTIESGASASVLTGSLIVTTGLTNNGTITIANNSNLVQPTGSTYSGSGSATVNRNSNPLYILDYTMWSSPVSGTQTLAQFSPLTSIDPYIRFYTYNPVSNKYANVAPTSTFAPGTGYLIRMPKEGDASYIDGTAPLTYNGQFTGIPNNGTLTLSDLTADKFYAVGNPYPSTISADAFINGNSTGGTLYFWRKRNAQAGSAYATYNLVGTTVTASASDNGSTVVPNGTIQVGQGFIVKTGALATSLAFTNAMRVANKNNQFFKTKQVQKDRVWLNLTRPATKTGTIDIPEAFSQALIGYMDGATLGVDDGIDGKYINDSEVALTSSINAEEYTIQGRPAFDPADVVALNFKTNADGENTIALDHFDGVFAAGQDVYLVDSKTGTETDLKAGAYTFNATSGIDNTRFSLKYQKTLKVDAPAFNENSVSVYKNNGALYVNSGFVAMSNIKVFDIQGRLIAEQKNLKSTTAVFNNLRAKNQVLIVKITGENNNVVSKKIVN